MSLKEELKKLKKRLVGESIQEEEKETISIPKKFPTACVTAKNVSLNDKVDAFVEWYYKNIVAGNLKEVGEYHAKNELRNLIEKMAVWYELRYPDYSINRMFPGSIQEKKDVSTVMFYNNPYICEQLEEDAETRILDWDKFYNVETFMESLPAKERYFFRKPSYKTLVYIDYNAHLHLTKEGIIEEAEWFGTSTNYAIKDEDLEGMHVTELREYCKKRGVILPPNNELDQMLQTVENLEKMREGLLDSVMYRIIERGGNRIGPRRGFLFAKELKRDINIPMMYGVDYSDPGLRRFINEYLKAGGSKNLVCYSEYFTCPSKYSILGVSTIEDILNSKWNKDIRRYTEEEIELQQKLVNILFSQIEEEELKRETVKQLRIERKLEKSRNRKNS